MRTVNQNPFVNPGCYSLWDILLYKYRYLGSGLNRIKKKDKKKIIISRKIKIIFTSWLLNHSQLMSRWRAGVTRAEPGELRETTMNMKIQKNKKTKLITRTQIDNYWITKKNCQKQTRYLKPSGFKNWKTTAAVNAVHLFKTMFNLLSGCI